MSNKVINFEDKRSESIEKKRRKFERLMFDNLLEVYAEVEEGEEIFPISLIDISRDGLQFEVPAIRGQKGPFSKDDTINIRLYFSSNSYLPATIEIKHLQENIEDGRAFYRYGCLIDKTKDSFTPLGSFIEFLYQFSEYSLTDRSHKKANSL